MIQQLYQEGEILYKITGVAFDRKFESGFLCVGGSD